MEKIAILPADTKLSKGGDSVIINYTDSKGAKQSISIDSDSTLYRAMAADVAELEQKRKCAKGIKEKRDLYRSELNLLKTILTTKRDLFSSYQRR